MYLEGGQGRGPCWVAGFGLSGGHGQDKSIDWYSHHAWEPVNHRKTLLGSTGHPQVTRTPHRSPEYSPSIGLIQHG